jgi:Ca2+-binding EF-hand superfamily protein
MSDSDNEAARGGEMNEEDEEARNREETAEVWNCFMQFDYEQQGIISTSDLKQALEHLNERVSDT